MLIVVTSRPSDLLLANHPFLALRRDLQARHLCHEMVLDMLTLADVERYLALEFREPSFPRRASRAGAREDRGQPAVHGGPGSLPRDNGTIAQDSDGRWVLRDRWPPSARELPESVRAMIERKIAQLGEDDRRC